MKNKNVGYLIVIIGLIIGSIIYMFNIALKDIVAQTCTHGPLCSMWKTIDYQTNISIVLMSIILLIGLYFIFFAKEEQEENINRRKRVEDNIIENKVPTKNDYKKILDTLKDDEKIILETIIDAQGSIFQSEISDKTKLTRVQVTRILDKLEGKNIITRKRRGMTNVVLLKY